MKSLARIALVVSLMVSIGGHWSVLQAIAWAKMLRAYTEERGIVAGLKDTFDGGHACAMCEKIATEKGKERQKNLPLTKVAKDNPTDWQGSRPVMPTPDDDWEGKNLTQGLVPPSSMDTQWDAPPAVPPPEQEIAWSSACTSASTCMCS